MRGCNDKVWSWIGDGVAALGAFQIFASLVIWIVCVQNGDFSLSDSSSSSESSSSDDSAHENLPVIVGMTGFVSLMAGLMLSVWNRNRLDRLAINDGEGPLANNNLFMAAGDPQELDNDNAEDDAPLIPVAY